MNLTPITDTLINYTILSGYEVGDTLNINNSVFYIAGLNKDASECPVLTGHFTAKPDTTINLFIELMDANATTYLYDFKGEI